MLKQPIKTNEGDFKHVQISSSHLPLSGDLGTLRYSSEALRQPIETDEGETGSPQNSRTLWELALDKITDEEKVGMSKLPVPGTDVIIFDQLFNVVTTKVEEFSNQSWKVTVKGNLIIVRDVIANIASKLEMMKSFGDIIANSIPQAALPWAAIQFLVQATSADQDQQGHLFVGIEAATILMSRCCIYESLFFNESKIDASTLSRLSDAIVDIYAKIISLLLQSIRLLERHTVSRVSHAFLNPDELPTILDELETLGTRAELEAANCERIESKNFRAQHERLYSALAELVNDRFVQVQRVVEDCWKILEAKEQSAILQWLSPIQYVNDHYNAKQGRTENTCEWLLQHDNFLQWSESTSSNFLWVHGIPGAGKTKLSTKVVDYALALSEHRSLGVAFFYCNRNRDDHRDPKLLLGSFVRQLSLAYDGKSVVRFIHQMYGAEEAKGLPGNLTYEQCVQLLIQLTEVHRDTFFILDGLDECDEKSRHSLIKALDHIRRESNATVKVYIASRDDGDIKTRYENENHLRISATDNKNDIKKFVIAKMDDDPWCRNSMSTELRQEILQIFQKKSQGMFQWAALHIDDLLGLQLEKDIRERVHKLPEGLKEAYDGIYEQILGKKGSASAVAIRAFQWLMCSLHEPLTPELLIILVSQDPDRDFCSKADVSIEYILGACHNLVTLKSQTFFQGQNDNICQFSHLSVQEYLEEHRLPIYGCHDLAAEVLLKYLLKPRDQLRGNLAWEWQLVKLDEHLRRGNDQWPEIKLKLFIEFVCDPFNGSDAYQAWARRRSRFKGWFEFRLPSSEDISPIFLCIHLAQCYPISEWVKTDCISADHIRKHGTVLLYVAAERGCLELCELFLELGAQVTAKQDGRQSICPLEAAVRYVGRQSPERENPLVDTLLRRGACVFYDAEDASHPPLSYLIDRGHLELIDRLLLHGGNINGFSMSGETPLIAASRCGNLELVKWVLARGADINFMPLDQTALTAAIYWGKVETANFLLSHGAKVHLDVDGKRHAAAIQYTRSLEITRELLKRGADPNDALAWHSGAYYSLGKEEANRCLERDMVLLEEYGADIHHRNAVNGEYPLMNAVLHYLDLSVEYFIECGADTSIKSDTLGTLLHAAVGSTQHTIINPHRRRALKIINILISRGLKPDIPAGRPPKTVLKLVTGPQRINYTDVVLDIITKAAGVAPSTAGHLGTAKPYHSGSGSNLDSL
ncbi:ankyrin [Xylariaceae sp. AK1471]|nr:ankyrin [Xylariaceae sp. AK1471]